MSVPYTVCSSIVSRPRATGRVRRGRGGGRRPRRGGEWVLARTAPRAVSPATASTFGPTPVDVPQDGLRALMNMSDTPAGGDKHHSSV